MALILALALMLGGPGIDPAPQRPASPPETPRAAPEHRTALPRPAGRIGPVAAGVRGIATWYAYRPGQAAAGPALRRALGPGWRGTVVTVCAGSSCLRVRLTDWMRADRLADLDSRSFAALAPLSRGVLEVTVSW